MSGIAAILRLDGAPADVAEIRRVLDRLVHRGGDGEAVVVAGPLALGHRRFWTTPEEVGEEQPIADPGGRYLLALDGRVDNRDELLAALAVATPAAAMTDARLLLAAFARWGVDAFARTVGSFAVAVWDRTERRLTLARDALGDRPLCYATPPGALVAASEEHAVLAHSGVDDTLDDRRLAQFLALAELDSDATFFAAVKEVPPGHALIAGDGGVKVVRYWTPALAEPLRLRDDREYAEAFLALLRDAVRARTRSITPVALMLSGGLDSSAIAAAAAGAAPALKAVSWVFDELPTCDERRWIDPVVHRCGLEPLQFAGDGEWPFREHAGWRRNPSTPENDLYRRLVERSRTTARAGGARVMLSGMFGDHLYSGTHGWLWERRRAAGVAAALAAGRQELATGSGWRGLLAGLTPRRLPAAALRLRRPTAMRRPWLTPYARSLLAPSPIRPTAVQGALRPAQARSVLGVFAAHGVAGETFHAGSAGVDMRYPFRDRRLVELMLRVPSDQLYRPGITRPIARLALHGLVPEEVRLRRGKGSLHALFRRGMRECDRAVMEETLAIGRPQRRRFVREDWLVQTVQGGRHSEIDDVALSACVFLARWLDK